MIFRTRGIVRVRNFSPCATVYDSLRQRNVPHAMGIVYARRNSLRTFAEKFLIARSQHPSAKYLDIYA